eukprot:scaffold157264_cov43-Prasinocladus_malaysianus.AAC.1
MDSFKGARASTGLESESMDSMVVFDNPALEGAGEDLFFDTLAASDALSGQVLVAVATRVVTLFDFKKFFKIDLA